MTTPRFFLAVLFLLATLVAFRPAGAQSPPRAVVVVAIDPSAAELDAGALRQAIADELGMDAVAPDDARATSARGTVSVAIDRDAKKLVVSYRAQGAPITRDVPLPADAAATSRAAVLLAGNLARDEASDLAAELRKRGPKVPAPTTRVDAKEPIEVDPRRLDATLAYYAEQDTRQRVTLGWSFIAAGAVASGAGIYMHTRSPGAGGVWVASTGGAFIAFGVGALFWTTDLETLWKSRQKGTGEEAIETRWADYAQTERRSRRITGGLLIGVGALMLTLGTLRLTTSALGASSGVDGAMDVGTGALEIGMGIYFLATNGSLEHALRVYENDIGRKAEPSALLASRFRLAMVPGGAIAGFGGTF